MSTNCTPRAAQLEIDDIGTIVVNTITVPASTVRAIAYRVAGGDGDLAQDCAQEMYLSLFQRPVTVAQDTKAKVTTRMAWEAKHELRRELTFKRYNQTAPDLVDEDGETADYFDCQASESASPEAVLIDTCEQDAQRAKVEALLANVPANTRLVARLIMAGDRPVDVARKLAVSKATVSRHLGIMRRVAG